MSSREEQSEKDEDKKEKDKAIQWKPRRSVMTTLKEAKKEKEEEK